MTTQPATLTATQRAVLAAAATHPQGFLTAYPENVNGGARVKVNVALERAGLARWNPKAQRFEITPAGQAAVGRDAPPPAQVDATPEEQRPTAPTKAPTAPTETPAAAPKPRTREHSKQAAVIAMLQRPEGATVAQICAATGWLQHTVRGTFAGAFKKKLGLTITSDKPAGGERVYRIA